MPPHSFGMFLVSRTPGFVPFFGGSQGNLCLGPPIGRFAHDVLGTGASGAFALDVDTKALPMGHGAVEVLPGETWCFQAWFRDANPGPTSNTTDGVAVTFE
jgi:hypothetical protein